MALCPSCNRPVAMARPRCLYCGAALPAEAVEEAAQGAAAAVGPAGGPLSPSSTADVPPGVARALLILDLTGGADPEALARALGLPLFEAGQRVLRGGYQLHKLDTTAEVEKEKDVLAAEGVRVLVVPEAEARRAPVLVIGGGHQSEGFRFRTGTGPLEVAARDVALVVKGPITREYQAVLRKRNKVATATLDAGYRIHLHRRSDPHPVEIDPLAFEFAGGAPITGSSLIEIVAWLDGLAGAVIDDAFRRETPALAPAAKPTGRDVRAALGPRPTRPGRDDTPLVLDNLDQFRFYSGWRAAVERRKATT
jgi:hypothetical protein